MNESRRVPEGTGIACDGLFHGSTETLVTTWYKKVAVKLNQRVSMWLLPSHGSCYFPWFTEHLRKVKWEKRCLKHHCRSTMTILDWTGDTLWQTICLCSCCICGLLPSGLVLGDLSSSGWRELKRIIYKIAQINFQGICQIKLLEFIPI